MIATLELEITAADRASILREWLSKPFHNALNVERVPASPEGDRRVIAGPFLSGRGHFESIVADAANFRVFDVPDPCANGLPRQNPNSGLPLHV
jgi:hypothetical protein